MASRRGPKANGTSSSSESSAASNEARLLAEPQKRLQQQQQQPQQLKQLHQVTGAASKCTDRRSQKLKEEIERLKSFIPASQAPLASLDFSIGTEPASLASCAPPDGEQAAFESRPPPPPPTPDAPSSSVDTTPTLSNYLDCDELSDMVDDSLFEITTAGCLSRSLFPRPPTSGARPRPPDGDQTPTNEPEQVGEVAPAGPLNESQTATRPPDSSAAASAAARQFVSAASSRLAGAAQMSSIMAHVQSHDYSSTSSVPRQIRGSLSIAAGYHNGAQQQQQQPDASRLAQEHHQQQKQQQQQKLISKVAGQKGAAAERSGLIASRRIKQRSLSGELEEEERAPNGAHHKQQAGGQRCPVCAANRQQQQQQQPGGAKRKTATTMSNCQRASSGSKKKGFASSLLSLFTGGGSGGGGGANSGSGSGPSLGQPTSKWAKREQQDLRQEQVCHLHRTSLQTDGANSARRKSAGGEPNRTAASQACRPVAQELQQQQQQRSNQRQHKTRPPNQRAAAAAASVASKGPRSQRDYPLPAMRLRDSIKITNQRKMRSSAAAAAAAAAARDHNMQTGPLPAPLPSEGEVLLVLSSNGSGKFNNGQSSVKPASTAAAAAAAAATKRAAVSAAHSSDSSVVSSSAANSNGSFRQRASSSSAPKNKCVKFTTPDRVMILSSPVGGATPRPMQSSSSYSSLAGPLQPAPIIKRPAAAAGATGATTTTATVPKSSSYSQTEPNRGLEELLARYEQDDRLVAEINEKLKLTETIASNLSALDAGEPSCEQSCDQSNPSSSASSSEQAESLDEDELLQRQLDIIDASRVFSWRPQDELAAASNSVSVSVSAASAQSSNNGQMEGAPLHSKAGASSSEKEEQELRAKEEQLEREAASRCECNNLIIGRAQLAVSAATGAARGQIGARNQIESDDQISGQASRPGAHIQRPQNEPDEPNGQDKIRGPPPPPTPPTNDAGQTRATACEGANSAPLPIVVGATFAPGRQHKEARRPEASAGIPRHAGRAPDWPKKETGALV